MWRCKANQRRKLDIKIGIGMLINSFCILLRDYIPHVLQFVLLISAIILMFMGMLQTRRNNDCE